MTIEQMKEWIDQANFYSLVNRWRSEPVDSPWFTGDLGTYYFEVMNRKRVKTPHKEQVAEYKATG